MQKEFAWERSSIEATISRIILIGKAERDLLIALVRIYDLRKSQGETVESEDGRVAIEPSKKELADALGVSIPTIKRKLKSIRGDSRFLSISGDHWRPHLYEIDFRAIYSAELKEAIPTTPAPQSAPRQKIVEAKKYDPPRPKNDPGSGGSGGGIMTLDQGDQIGGSGGSPGAPYKKSIPFNPNNNRSSQSIPSGSLKSFSFINLSKRDFQEPIEIQKRYEQALAAGRVKDCENDRLTFFALVIHIWRTRKNIKNPPGLLTDFMRGYEDKFGQTWRTRPKDKDSEKARKMINHLDFPPMKSTPVDDHYSEPEELEVTEEPEEKEVESEEEFVGVSQDVERKLREAQERNERRLRECPEK